MAAPSIAPRRPSALVTSQNHHLGMLAGGEEVLRELRARLMIPATWSIELEFVCPKELPDAFGQASWTYLPGRAYHIRVRCTLSPEELEWVLTHELLEILLGDLYVFTSQEIESHRAAALRLYLANQHRELRDSAIEWLIHVILKKPRPLAALA